MSLYKNSDIESIEYTRNVYRIKWRVTGWCNFHCPYCIDRFNKEESGKWNKMPLLLDRAERLNDFLKYNNIQDKIHLSLLGGEVTYFDLKSLVNKIDNLSHLNITTNFSRDLDYFKDLFIWSRQENIRLFINCSYHEQSKNFLEKFISLTKWCKENKFSCPRVSRVITDEMDIENWLKDYVDNGITRIMLTKNKSAGNDEFNPLTSKQQIDSEIAAANYEYTEKQGKKDFKITLKDGRTLFFTSISHFLNNLDKEGFIPDGFYCNCGHRGIMVNWDGKIYGSHCFELENKPLGDLNINAHIKLPSQLYYCNNPNIRCCVRNGTSVYRNKSLN